MDASGAGPITISDPHPTLVKFGYPSSLIHQGNHWALLVRPAQPTLGSLILCAIEDVRSYGEIGGAAFAEQGEFVPRIERMLRQVCLAERLNYLMLMMVDPQVHFHIIPRYQGERHFEGVAYPDSGWPALPELKTERVSNERLIDVIRMEWERTA